MEQGAPMIVERPTKYWIVVASKDHVETGKKLGIVQVNHGKAAPLKRMKAGDLIAFYSPKLQFQGKEPLKKFTAIARVKEGEIYQGNMGGSFIPYRRDVEFIPCGEADIQTLIPKLTFIKNKKSWGIVFRFGFLEIPKEDYETITKKMDLAG
jgi:predicted RNA-binding protein